MDFDQAENPPILSAGTEAPAVRFPSVSRCPAGPIPLLVAAASDAPPREIIGSTAAQTHAPRRRASSIAAAISVIGELLLTLGVLVLLYVVWQLWWTNIEAGNLQDEAVAEMSRSYEGPLEPAPRAP